MAIRRTLAQFSDEIVAADIAADAVGASELADNAVDTAAIATNAVTATEIAATAVTAAKLNTDVTDGSAIATSVKPHIQPGVLQPAIAGKLLNGANHSGAYGTAQTQSGGDGHNYYYTDIKGSKPIKDPRIGVHFGSQRHMITSAQILEQETATHGENVYSIDGREWMRIVTGQGTIAKFDTYSSRIYANNWGTDAAFIEVVGYFNSINIGGMVWDAASYGVKYAINGAAYTTANPSFVTGLSSPLVGSRYVNGSSILNIPVVATLGINTVKINTGASMHSLELIVQDTTSDATKVQIQIPAQNVVSYGKKFSLSAAAHHYNPFAFAGDGTTAVAIGNTTSHGKVATGWAGSTSAYFDSTLDTATSLGLAAWEHSGDFYRPIMGGRIVKWIDSSGNIKTSVNMMPPAGTGIGNATGTNTPVAENWTTRFQPVEPHSTTIDHSQAEVAKTFHFTEFGNGAANQGNNTSGSLQDASMLSGNDDIVYTMDDGLTGLAAKSCQAPMGSGYHTIMPNGDGQYFLLTFIGTGLTIEGTNNSAGIRTIVQNLPYGTHIFKSLRDADGNPDFTIDGIAMNDVAIGTYAEATWFTIHQPKMPPIPENACIISDYMLMADFVPQTATGIEKISKGVRACSISRDMLSNGVTGQSWTFQQNPEYYSGWRMYQSQDANGTNWTHRTPSFCTNWIYRGKKPNQCSLFNGSSAAGSQTEGTNATLGSYRHLTSAVTLGIQNCGMNPGSGQNADISGMEFVIPTHTSSHYQTFESPYLKELVGGDRNMEQTNLVVTADGKSWDEVTRDTSYIGNQCVSTTTESTIANAAIIMNKWRGELNGVRFYFNKDFAISYDRITCLKDGYYNIYWMTYVSGSSAGKHVYCRVNGVNLVLSYIGGAARTDNLNGGAKAYLKRGDYITLYGYWNDAGDSANYNAFWIERS